MVASSFSSARCTERRTRKLLAGALLASALGLPFAAAAQGAADAAALGDGAIVLFRHANAPGVGDPPGFTPGDCRTQRNLDDAGRAQARRIGETLRARGVKVGAVWASPWCRTLDTARLAFPGLPVQEVAALGSFFEGRADRATTTREADAQLAAWKGPGVLVVVTHQVNISALADVTTSSGEGVIVRRQPDGRWVAAARLPPP
jgi:phosphohistidine phosphatase SixA